MALLRALNREQGVTLLLVTHDPEAAAFADLVIQLRDGAIVDEPQVRTGGGELL
jgi:macrolide transport system ATP-binding/permease protein